MVSAKSELAKTDAEVATAAAAVVEAKAEADALKREAEVRVRSQVADKAVARAEVLLNFALDAGSQNKILTASVKKMGELSAS